MVKWCIWTSEEGPGGAKEEGDADDDSNTAAIGCCCCCSRSNADGSVVTLTLEAPEREGGLGGFDAVRWMEGGCGGGDATTA